MLKKPVGDATKLHVKVEWGQLALDYCPIAHQ
jgi:hypothetical protein